MYYHLHGNPDQQQFKFQSGVLTGNDIRRRSTTIARMNKLWTAQSAARQTHLCPSQLHYSLHPAVFSGNDFLLL